MEPQLMCTHGKDHNLMKSNSLRNCTGGMMEKRKRKNVATQTKI